MGILIVSRYHGKAVEIDKLNGDFVVDVSMWVLFASVSMRVGLELMPCGDMHIHQGEVYRLETQKIDKYRIMNGKDKKVIKEEVNKFLGEILC